MKKEKANALFLLAGFEIESMFELVNQYWPEAYTELIQENPWWLVKTEHGLIKIGHRKRVINIDWSDTDYRAEKLVDENEKNVWPNSITKDEVTRSETNVHAWSYLKALEYLTSLHVRLNEKPAREAKVDTY